MLRSVIVVRFPESSSNDFIETVLEDMLSKTDPNTTILSTYDPESNHVICSGLSLDCENDISFEDLKQKVGEKIKLNIL